MQTEFELMIMVPSTLDDNVIICGDGGLAATTSGSAAGPITIEALASTRIVLVEPVAPY